MKCVGTHQRHRVAHDPERAVADKGEQVAGRQGQQRLHLLVALLAPGHKVVHQLPLEPVGADLAMAPAGQV